MPLRQTELVIDPRFRGPPRSANGGYACGLVAEAIDGPCDVSLRVPPPLGVPLEVERMETGRVVLRDGETIVAEGAPAGAVPDAPPAVGTAAAAQATGRFTWHGRHPFPECFACGPDRAPGDGLRIFAGPVAGLDGVVAAPWTPDPSFGEPGESLDVPVVWAALDCTSGGALRPDEMAGPAVLARLTAAILAPVRVGVPCVAVGRLDAHDGRKVTTGSALYGPGDELLAVSSALWIELRPDQAAAAMAV